MPPLLDAGPPTPPNLPTSPSSSGGMSSLAPQSPQDTGSGGTGGLQQSVIQKLMAAENALRSAATDMPELGPIVDTVISQLRAQAGRVIAGSTQGAAQTPQQTLLGMLGGGAAPQL